MPDGSKITQLPIETRLAPLNSFDAKARTATVVVSAGAPVKRYDWARERYYSEELVINADAVNMTRINGSGVSVLNNHDQYSGLDAVLGRASNGRIENKQLVADVRFSQRDDIAGLVRDIGDGIITDVSVGYTRDQIEMIPPDASKMGTDALWTYRLTKWTPMEVSFVTVPADPNAGMRSGAAAHAFGTVTLHPCEVREVPNPVPAGADHSRKENTMSDAQKTGAGTDPNAAEIEATRLATEKAVKDATAAERKRNKDITDACRVAKLPDEFARALIDDDKITADVARARIIDEMAAQQKGDGKSTVDGNHNVSMGATEMQKVRVAIESAITHRLDSSKALPDNGASDFRHMSLMRMAEEILVRRGESTRGMRKLEMAARAFGTTDFTGVLANVMNKRLRMGYDENPGTYQQWAYKAPNAPDFKTITVTQISAAPDFVLKNPGDEFKYGSASDGKETYAALTYARGMGFTREAMINDDLRAFDRLVTGFGAAARRLENRAVYNQLVANAVLGNDNIALFDATTHKNYTSSGTVISVASLTIGRKQMRVQTGLQSEVLNLAPRYLIVPAALEQVAYQYTSNLYQPTQPSNINEFRAGGKTALEVVVEAQLDSLHSLDNVTDYSSATAWYLAADAGQVDTVEYCYIDGYDGVWLEQEMDFDTDALKFKGRLDFATKAIDYRGLYKNVGA